MAKFYGANYTLATPGPNFQPIPSGDQGGSMRCVYDSFTAPAGGLAINDTIDFGAPAGAVKSGDRIVGARIITDALGAGALLQLGDDAVANRFITATDASAAATLTFNNLANFGYQVDINRPLRVTLTGAVMAAGKNIKILVELLRS